MPETETWKSFSEGVAEQRYWEGLLGREAIWISDLMRESNDDLWWNIVGPKRFKLLAQWLDEAMAAFNEYIGPMKELRSHAVLRVPKLRWSASAEPSSEDDNWGIEVYLSEERNINWRWTAGPVISQSRGSGEMPWPFKNCAEQILGLFFRRCAEIQHERCDLSAPLISHSSDAWISIGPPAWKKSKALTVVNYEVYSLNGRPFDSPEAIAADPRITKPDEKGFASLPAEKALMRGNKDATVTPGATPVVMDAEPTIYYRALAVLSDGSKTGLSNTVSYSEERFDPPPQVPEDKRFWVVEADRKLIERDDDCLQWTDYNILGRFATEKEARLHAAALHRKMGVIVKVVDLFCGQTIWGV